MVFITLAVFLTRYYREMVFWALFAAKDMGFRALQSYAEYSGTIYKKITYFIENCI